MKAKGELSFYHIAAFILAGLFIAVLTSRELPAEARTWDENNDGLISQEEFPKNKNLFYMLDQNSDGVLNSREVLKYSESLHQ